MVWDSLWYSSVLANFIYDLKIIDRISHPKLRNIFEYEQNGTSISIYQIKITIHDQNTR